MAIMKTKSESQESNTIILAVILIQLLDFESRKWQESVAI